jgi:2-hydroxy-6-oxonona-2,4-dienedioate hydrolase
MLAYELVEGRLPGTLVLLPGLLAGKWIWKDQFPLLRGMDHSILIFSNSFIKIQGKINGMEDLCSCCEHVILEHATTPILILGNSIGGLVSIILAHRLPGVVAGIVASGVPGLGGEINLGIGTKNIMSSGYTFKIAQKIFFDQSQIAKSEISHMFDEGGTSHSLLQAARILRSARGLRVEELVSKLEQPALLIWGSEDKITPSEPWRKLAERHKVLEFYTLSRSGHCPMVEAASRFNALTGPFIKKVLSQAAVDCAWRIS